MGITLNYKYGTIMQGFMGLQCQRNLWVDNFIMDGHTMAAQECGLWSRRDTTRQVIVIRISGLPSTD